MGGDCTGEGRGKESCSDDSPEKGEQMAELCTASSLVLTLVSVIDQLQAAGVATVRVAECITCQLFVGRPQVS